MTSRARVSLVQLLHEQLFHGGGAVGDVLVANVGLGPQGSHRKHAHDKGEYDGEGNMKRALTRRGSLAWEARLS